MTYIINPWIFYLINLCYNLSWILVVIMVISGLWLIFSIVAFCVADQEKEKEEVKKHCKVVLIIFAVTAFISIFVPSEKTIYSMLIAKVVTVENVTAVYEAILNAAEKIITSIRG